MEIQFYKYQGTGNDFIIIDDRKEAFDTSNSYLIASLCHRNFGIGADGLMLIREAKGFDFEMIYFNSDGKPSSMCGNGGRCITALAKRLNMIDSEGTFIATDGAHDYFIGDESSNVCQVKLKMNDVKGVEKGENYAYLNTGSPHYVVFEKEVEKIDIIPRGRAIRNNARFKEEGTNVNFVEQKNGFLFVRTYERGVENETLSCGTGVTASAIAAHAQGIIKEHNSKIKTPGGDLEIYFEPSGINYTNIWLEGPAALVFMGEINI